MIRMTEKRFKMIDEDIISFDGYYFNRHKPSDMRALVIVVNDLLDVLSLLKVEQDAFKDKLQDMGVSDFKYGGVRYFTGLCDDLDD